MWGPTGVDAPSTPKDLPALKAALDETGTQLTAQLAEPRTQFMIPPWDHSEFYRKLDEGVEIAHFLGTPRMVVGSGTGFGGWKRQVQLDKLIEIYQKAIAQIEGSGITLVLEPVNVRVDHPGSLLDRTSEGVYVARGVDSPFFGVLYDIYHSAVEGEDIAAELANAGSTHQVRAARRRARPRRARHRIDSTGPRRSATLRALRLRRTDRPRVLPADRRPRVGAATSSDAGGRGMSERVYPESVDVAIVGSGPAGAAYARILSEQAPGATIAMFEVGPTVTEPAGRAREEHRRSRRARQRADALGGSARAGERRSHRRHRQDRRSAGRDPGTFLLESGYQVEGEDGLPVAAMSSNVGGMAAHWTGACPRPNDSERIAFLDADGSFDELLSEAERLLGRDDRRVRQLAVRRRSCASAWPRPRTPAAIATTRVQRMPLAVHRRDDGNLVWSGSDVVFGDVDPRQPPNFTLFDESLVTRVLVEDGRAAGVVVTDRRTGESSQVRARFVVVAADALRTPQLLWASGIRPDALGRYLNDQAQIVFAVRIRDLVPDRTTATGPAPPG